MSSVGQAVGAVVGGTIGFFASGGNPMGAVYGAQIGAGIGGVVDPPVVPGQRIGELAAQTAREGDPRAIVFGTPRPIGGNVIATTDPIIRKKRQKSGGKGGGGSEVENEEIYRTYAIGICEGPITGIRRIWRDGKLVYFSGNPAFAQNNAKFLQNVTLYNGSFDQMPSSVLESALGIDNVTPFRGTAYMVMNNENLTNTGGRIPQWNFEPVRSEGFVFTSRPYPIETSESLHVNSPAALEPTAVQYSESVDLAGPVITSGSMYAPLEQYGYQEQVDLSGPVIVSGELKNPLITHNIEHESIDLSGPSLVSGSMYVAQIDYAEYPPESINLAGPTITGGSLT